MVGEGCKLKDREQVRVRLGCCDTTHPSLESEQDNPIPLPACSAKDPNGSEVPGPTLEKIYPVEINLLQLLN